MWSGSETGMVRKEASGVKENEEGLGGRLDAGEEFRRVGGE